MIRRSVASFAKVRVPLKEVSFVTRKVSNAFTCPLPPPLPPHTNANRPTLVLGVQHVLLATGTLGRRSKATLRPYLAEFLTEVMQLYEVVFWESYWGPSTTYGAMHLLESVLKLPHSTVYNPHTKVPFVADEGTQHVPPHFYALTKNEVIPSMRKKKSLKLLPVLGRPMSRVVLLDCHLASHTFSPRNSIDCGMFRSFLKDWEEYDDFIDDAVKQGCVTPISEYEGELDTALWKPNPAKKKWPQKVSELPTDTTLLDLLPMLRKVAAAQDVTSELDHWRQAGYTMFDDLDWNLRQYYGTWDIGKHTTVRNATPIAPLVLTEKNALLLFKAKHTWIAEDLAARSRLLLTGQAAAVVVSDGQPMAVSHAAVAAGGDSNPHPAAAVGGRDGSTVAKSCGAAKDAAAESRCGAAEGTAAAAAAGGGQKPQGVASPCTATRTAPPVDAAAKQPEDKSKGRTSRKRQRETHQNST